MFLVELEELGVVRDLDSGLMGELYNYLNTWMCALHAGQGPFIITVILVCRRAGRGVNRREVEE